MNVGLAAGGTQALVADYLQARRFATLYEAERYAGRISASASAFEIEARTTP